MMITTMALDRAPMAIHCLRSFDMCKTFACNENFNFYTIRVTLDRLITDSEAGVAPPHIGRNVMIKYKYLH